MERKILHLDLDAFFCAVEQLRKPELDKKPFAVGGRPEERGVVSSCSYPARMYGIKSAMPMKQALQLYPQLIILPPDHIEYQKYSQEVMDVLHQTSPMVEQTSIDEAFLDVSDLAEHPKQIAYKLQSTILESFKLPSSLGAASNKLIAKIGNDFGKSQNQKPTAPLAITYVPPGNEANFLAPLPITALLGVGPKTSAKFVEMGIKTIGDLAKYPEEILFAKFGKYGIELSRSSRGYDDRPVITSHTTKSISQEITFAQDRTDLRILRQTLKDLSEEISQRLRDGKLSGKTIRLKLRLYNFQTFTRQITLSQPTDQTEVIFEAADHLFSENWVGKVPIRLIGVGVSNLDTYPRQLNFLNPSSERSQRLQTAIDNLHKRFGNQSIRRGKL